MIASPEHYKQNSVGIGFSPFSLDMLPKKRKAFDEYLGELLEKVGSFWSRKKKD
jgi:hypothetical protein